uniref:ATP-dependent RNA helicase TDRD9 (Trinotate prediction) n=1 Tax=Henneguya salminicola TaxID=69463 RepID=A0A6G3MDR8_HENSL
MSNLEWDNSGIRKKGVRKFFEVTQALRKEVQKSGKNEPFQRFETNNPITNTVEQKNGEYIEKIKNDYEDSKEEDPKKFNTYLMEPDIIQFSNSSELCSDPVETQPDCTHIYKTYNFKYVYDINLPVFYYREKILDVINTYPVCIIAGSTGSGKTTVIPQFIIDEHAEQQKFCNIIITQPRRVAAITTARRVSMERGWAMGTVVGYSVSLQKIISEDTRITYVTTGVLLQCLVSNPQYIKMFSHIIIDEAHERTEEIDLCLLVLRNAFKDSSSSVKLILMSATIDCKIFSEYFSNEINETLNSAPILEIVGRQYPVQLHYLDDIPLIETNNAHINKPELNEDCIKVCTNIIENLSNYDCTFHKNSSFGASLKSALVFLPGLHEILELNRTIRPYAEKHKLILLNLHSKLPPDEQLNIFFPAKQGYRKIIFATNIAESSITVPDIGYVIDFCLQKVVNWDQSTNLCHLKLSWVSKSSAEQRMGRAGRLDKGICFRLVHESIFDSFDQNNVPDMKRKPLEFVILNIKKIFKGPPILMLQLVLEPPQLTDVFRSILVLKEVGALTTTVNGIFDPNDGEVTLLGEVIRVLPLDMKLSKLIAMGYIFGLLDECAVIASCISLGCIFVSPIQKELESFMSKRAYSQGTNSDLIVYLTVYKVLKKPPLNYRIITPLKTKHRLVDKGNNGVEKIL